MALRPMGERWAVTKDAPGLTALVRRLQESGPQRMVLDATGGDQRAVVAGLATAGRPVVVVNPRQARDCATATGPRATPDALDARPRLLDLPELGPLSRQRRAALVGGAPCKRERGPLRGTRTIWGGRAHVRTTLALSTLVAGRDNPGRKPVYARRRAAGKAAKVALTACRRTLLTLRHAMVKHPTPWQPQAVAVA
jgi:transposase